MSRPLEAALTRGCLPGQDGLWVRQEKEDQAGEGNEQKFQSLDEAIAAIKQMAEAGSMQPQEEPGEGTPQEEGSPDEEEENAMMGGFRPGVRG